MWCVLRRRRTSVSGMPNANFNREREGVWEASVNAGKAKAWRECVLRLVLLFMNYLGHFSNGYEMLEMIQRGNFNSFCWLDLHHHRFDHWNSALILKSLNSYWNIFLLKNSSAVLDMRVFCATQKRERISALEILITFFSSSLLSLLLYYEWKIVYCVEWCDMISLKHEKRFFCF
jgi:hypothetical protein